MNTVLAQELIRFNQLTVVIRDSLANQNDDKLQKIKKNKISNNKRYGCSFENCSKSVYQYRTMDAVRKHANKFHKSWIKQLKPAQYCKSIEICNLSDVNIITEIEYDNADSFSSKILTTTDSIIKFMDMIDEDPLKL